jgi:hypothetical protein
LIIQNLALSKRTCYEPLASTHPDRQGQAELWAGQARTELEWAKSLSKRLSEGAYTMADDPGSWRTVPDHLKMRA